MNGQKRIGAVADLPPGKVIGVGHYAVGNAGGRYSAVTRRCRHLGADLAAGSIDANGCLVCPWHGLPTASRRVGWFGDRRGSSSMCPAWTSDTACSRVCYRWDGRR